jgi:hypothetical protein
VKEKQKLTPVARSLTESRCVRTSLSAASTTQAKASSYSRLVTTTYIARSLLEQILASFITSCSAPLQDSEPSVATSNFRILSVGHVCVLMASPLCSDSARSIRGRKCGIVGYLCRFPLTDNPNPDPRLLHEVLKNVASCQESDDNAQNEFQVFLRNKFLQSGTSVHSGKTTEAE